MFFFVLAGSVLVLTQQAAHSSLGIDSLSDTLACLCTCLFDGCMFSSKQLLHDQTVRWQQQEDCGFTAGQIQHAINAYTHSAVIGLRLEATLIVWRRVC